MSTFRKHFRVSWNDGEPVDIITTARDMADAAEVASDNPFMAGVATVHAALKRNGVDVPPFQDFLDVLDEMTPSKNGTHDSVDPTAVVDSMTEPSQYPS